MFFKKDGQTLLIAAESVISNKYKLFVSEKDNYNLPIDGWYFFETEEEARTFFKIPKVNTI